MFQTLIVLGLSTMLGQSVPPGEFVTIRSPGAKALQQVEASLRQVATDKNAAPIGRTLTTLVAGARSSRDRLVKSAQALHATIEQNGATMSPEQVRDCVAQAKAHNDEVDLWKIEIARLSKIAEAALRGDQTGLGSQARALTQDLDQRIKGLEAAKRRDAVALRGVISLSPAISRAVEEWEKLSEEARAEARKKARSVGLELFLQGSKDLLETRGKITEGDMENLAVRILVEPGRHPRLIKRLIDLGDRLERIESAKEAVELVEAVVTEAELSEAMTKEEKLELVVEVAKLAVQDPAAKLFLSDVELCTAVGYAALSKGLAVAEFRRAIRISEADLQIANRHGAALRRESDELTELRRGRLQLAELEKENR